MDGPILVAVAVQELGARYRSLQKELDELQVKHRLTTDAADPQAELERALAATGLPCGLLLRVHEEQERIGLTTVGDCSHGVAAQAREALLSESERTARQERQAAQEKLEAEEAERLAREEERQAKREARLAHRAVQRSAPGPRLAVQPLRVRVGDAAYSWGAGSAVELRLSPHWSVGGSLLYLQRYFASTQLSALGRWYATSFAWGFFLQLDAGLAGFAMRGSSTGATVVGTAAGWRLASREENDGRVRGFLDLGLSAHAEHELVADFLGAGRDFGFAFELAGGLQR